MLYKYYFWETIKSQWLLKIMGLTFQLLRSFILTLNLVSENLKTITETAHTYIPRVWMKSQIVNSFNSECDITRTRKAETS